MTVDTYHQGLLDVVTDLTEAALRRNRWDDDPPLLGCVGTDLRVWRASIPERIWRGREAVDVVRGVTAALGHQQPRVLAGNVDVAAVVLVHEAWTLDAPEGATHDERVAAGEFCRTRSIADHPWGAEAKIGFAAGVDGWRYAVTRLRHRPAGEGYADAVAPEPLGHPMSGRYPEALAELAAATQEVRA